jgi:hypothetical protein
MASMGLNLGLLYQLTKEEKYGKKLYESMSHYGRYVRWGGPGLADRRPPWHSELDTSEFCLGFACGYDMLHSYLSADQRKEVSSALIQLGIMPILLDWITPPARFHSLDSMGHNWWGVCVAGAGVGALALLGDEPRAADWIDQINSGFEEWFSYAGNALHNRFETFDPDGPSYEGVHYTGYGLSGYLRYLFAWKQLFPERQAGTEGYLKSIPEFFVHTTYPSSKGNLAVNFDDCPVDDEQSETILLLQACGIEDDYTRAYFDRYDRNRDQQFHFYFRKVNAGQPNPSFPLMKVYPEMGWAIARSSWQKDATLLAVKAGYTWNHAHADASTFILMHAGAQLIIDSGTCSYGDHKYTSYYRQSQAHNVVLFDGEGQPSNTVDIGSKFPGRILKWLDGCGLRYICADATGPMAHKFGRNYRSFLWIGNCILIVDDIASYSPGKFDWLLHVSGAVERIGNQALRLRNDDLVATVSMLYPAVRIDTRKGYAPQMPQQEMDYYAFVADTNQTRQRFISVIDLDPSKPSKASVRETPDYLEMTVDQAGERHLVYLNLRAIDGPYNLSSTVDINGWSTDAYILAARLGSEPRLNAPSAVARFLVVDGSFVRHGAESICESLSKGDFLWAPGVNLEVFSQSQKKTSVMLYSSLSPVQVLWNGVHKKPRYDSQRGLAHLTTSELHD